MLKHSTKIICQFVPLFLFVPTVKANILKCSEINILSASPGTQCRTNTNGSFIEKLQDGGLKFSNGTLWMPPNNGFFNLEQALDYCKSIDARTPTINEVEALLSEIKDLKTGKAQQVFTSAGTYGASSKNHVWLADYFSSAMGYLWILDTNVTYSRYYSDYPFNAICIKN